jgi:hypothetical protein
MHQAIGPVMKYHETVIQSLLKRSPRLLTRGGHGIASEKISVYSKSVIEIFANINSVEKGTYSMSPTLGFSKSKNPQRNMNGSFMLESISLWIYCKHFVDDVRNFFLDTQARFLGMHSRWPSSDFL